MCAAKKMEGLSALIAEAASAPLKTVQERALKMATVKTTGGVLYEFAAFATGVGIAAAEAGTEINFGPVWKGFANAFYVGDRARPKVGKGGDHYGNAMEKFFEIGNSPWAVERRYAAMEYIMAQKAPKGSTGGYGVPNKGNLAAKFLKEYPDTAPTDAQMKAIRQKELDSAKSRGASSQFKARAAALVAGMAKLLTSNDIDVVLAEYPAIAKLFVPMQKSVKDFGEAAKTHFKAKAEAAKAAKTKTPKATSAKSGMTAAARDQAALEKYTAIAALAAKGSNGKVTKATATKH